VKIGSFSKIEIQHLAISVFVMSFIIAYSNTGGQWVNSVFWLIWLPIALVVMAPAFVLHELGHKIAAQHFGYWAEYRMWGRGLMFAFLLVVISSWIGSPFVFIAPGAVYFRARGGFKHSGEDVGKVGLAGPLVNLFLVLVFASIGLLSTGAILSGIAFLGAYVNAFLAIFNLIPFPPFDGQKVYKWNKQIWGLMMALSVGAFIFAGGF